MDAFDLVIRAAAFDGAPLTVRDVPAAAKQAVKLFGMFSMDQNVEMNLTPQIGDCLTNFQVTDMAAEQDGPAFLL